MTQPITVVLADDHPLFRKGVADVLRGDAAIRVVGEAPDGDRALSMIRQLRPQVAVLDIDMPGRNGLEIARETVASQPDTIVVLLTMYAGADMLQRALAAGARGYVSKESAADDLLACLHLVAAGRTYVSASLGEAPLAAASLAPVALEQLTPSERGVLKRIAASRTSRDIAGELGITVKTVEHHRANICQKLGVSGNNALVRFCLEHSADLARL